MSQLFCTKGLTIKVNTQHDSSKHNRKTICGVMNNYNPDSQNLAVLTTAAEVSMNLQQKHLFSQNKKQIVHKQIR